MVNLPYNITNITAANGTLETAQAINQLTNGVLGHGWSIVIFVVIFALGQVFTRDFRKSLLGASALSLVIGLFFYYGKFINPWFLIVYVALMVVSVILLQDRDLSV